MNTIDTLTIAGGSLRNWHMALTTDNYGNDSGWDTCPGSRFGYYAESCAWWAIAATYVFETEGYIEDIESAWNMLYSDMEKAVNDDAALGEFILEYWQFIPSMLRKELSMTKTELRKSLA